jgi:two-component system sensor kinase FixL
MPHVANRGISSEQLTQVFKPFHTTKPSGMGMGLAIARNVVENHGGKIWAENNVDYGATVGFILPVEGAEK